MMSGKERRVNISRILEESTSPVAGGKLAKAFGVSRQVLVQDIALLRATGCNIISTSRGYELVQDKKATRVFKVHHREEELVDELNLYVDYGARVKDVFVYHRAYGVIRAEMNIGSRLDVINYCKCMEGGNSSLLLNLTDGYHYHTIEADSEEILDLIQEKLQEKGYFAKLRDYEPVDFWSEKA